MTITVIQHLAKFEPLGYIIHTWTARRDHAIDIVNIVANQAKKCDQAFSGKNRPLLSKNRPKWSLTKSEFYIDQLSKFQILCNVKK
jgi:hypothetical protein